MDHKLIGTEHSIEMGEELALRVQIFHRKEDNFIGRFGWKIGDKLQLNRGIEK